MFVLAVLKFCVKTFKIVFLMFILMLFLNYFKGTTVSALRVLSGLRARTFACSLTVNCKHVEALAHIVASPFELREMKPSVYNICNRNALLAAAFSWSK